MLAGLTKSLSRVILLGLLAAGSAYSQLRDGDVTILRSDEHSLVLEYRPRYKAEKIVRDGSREMKLFDFEGSISIHTKDLVGSPDLRFEALPLGFPGPGGNTAQLIATDYEDIPGVILAPIPVLRSKGEMVEVDGYRMSQEKYSSLSFLPDQPVEIVGPSRNRSLWVGSMRLFPVQYNPSTRTVRKYSRMVVEVVYGPSTQRRVQGKDDDRMFDGVLFNNGVARNWKTSEDRALNKAKVVSSVLANGDWYRLTVVDEGIYILTAPYLRSIGINPATIDPRTVKIYGNSGAEVPEYVFAQRPIDLVENAIYVEGEGDGSFNEGDYVMFFARSVRNWTMNTSSHLLTHSINHYTEQNAYWLTFGGRNGKRMTVRPSLTDNPVSAPTKFLDGVLIEEEKINVHGSGKDWLGKSFTPNEPFTYVSILPGLVPNDTIKYRFRLLAALASSSSFVVSESGSSLGEFVIGSVGEDPVALIPFPPVTGNSNNLSNNTSRLNFTFRGSVAATGWNDWIEIQYPRRFEAPSGSNYLRFRSADNVTGIVEYTLGQFTSSPFILNVTRPDSVCRIVGALGTYAFRTQETAGTVSEYCAAGFNAFKQPVSATRVANQNLHGEITGPDFIIITSPEYRAAAERLKSYREQPQHGGLKTIVVDVNQIYNEFGGGLPDVTAIRDFLKFAYDPLLDEQFVLFLGQGSYDYKGLLGFRSSYVPTWQSDESLGDIASYCTDDFFVEFDTSPRPFLVTGRVNARLASEADAFVTKLMRYENESARDSWKMRMLFVGDDGLTSEGDDGILHTQQAESLAVAYTPNEFEKKKIYIADYPTVQTAQGRRKPGAYQDIIDRINEGMLIVNFTGHGNPTVWTHESIFTVSTSIPSLVNANKAAVFFLATCNFSQFDDPKRYTGSELLVNKPDGAAIGAVSATRKVFSDGNAYLHQQTFLQMFGDRRLGFRRDSLGRLDIMRPAAALQSFKFNVLNSDNDQKYFFMGDPTMRLQFPSGYASIDSINTERVDSVDGTSRTSPIQIKALAKVSVKGTVRNATNQPDTTVRGRILLTVNDAARMVAIPGFGNPPFRYMATGGTIYRGQNSISQGRFNATFIVPKDILYADSTSRGRLVAYFVDSVRALEGAGFTENIYVGGTDTSSLVDTHGPSMSLYLGSRSFRPGDVVGESPVLLVDLSDSNGINTSGSGIGHRIEAWLNGSSQSMDVTDYYTSQLNDYQKGTVQYVLRGLPQGRNVIRVRAWDTYNNAASTETFFEVASTDQLRISDVFNYPNPFSSGTFFTFRQNLLASLNVTVKIYSVAGRLIQSLPPSGGLPFVTSEPFVKIPWDGRDRDGDILANGVYLYKLIVRTSDGRFGSEVLGKLSVLK